MRWPSPSSFFAERSRTSLATWLGWKAISGLRAADRLRTGLLAATTALETDPHRHPQADEATELGIDLRETLFGRRRHVYRIFFTIDDASETVFVHRVRYAAQDRLAPGDV